MRPAPLLPQAFCARDAVVVARALIGQELWLDSVGLRITETEAYPPGDSASHCRSGRTARNAPMWGPPGHVYVYLCYGIHMLLNITTNDDGVGAAVLIRGCEPIAGLSTVRERRGGGRGAMLLSGPGKVGSALGIDTTLSGHALYEPGGLSLHGTVDPAPHLLVGARVGIDYATPEDVAAPYRFALAGSAHVSRPRELKPWRPPRRSSRS